MSTEVSTEIEAVEQITNLPSLPDQFGEENLQKLFKQVEDEVKSEVADVETQDGRKRIKDLAAKISKSNKAIDEPIRNHLRVMKALPKVLELNARNSKSRFEKLREGVLEPLTKAQEFQNQQLEWLVSVPVMCTYPNIDSDQLKQHLADIETIGTCEIWPELKKKFKVAIEAATTSATVTLERVETAEKQAAELAELRKQQEEAERKEHDRKVAAEAEEKAKREAEQKACKEREDIERRAVEAKQREEEAKQREIRAKHEAEQAEKRRIAEAEAAEKRAEQAKIDAENRAKAAAKKAAEDERKRIEEEEAEQKRLAEAREADKNHRIKINRAALVALVAGGLSEEDAKTAITLIAKRQVPNISIQY